MKRLKISKRQQEVLNLEEESETFIISFYVVLKIRKGFKSNRKCLLTSRASLVSSDWTLVFITLRRDEDCRLFSLLSTS